ncbi:hypothetical protein WJH60_00330 [Burkholderia orbicola]|uniref:hypothetical protein n=1 Tax=Burkholderia orbicola TaxID=2978683 RepID=UPI0035C6F5EA
MKRKRFSVEHDQRRHHRQTPAPATPRATAHSEVDLSLAAWMCRRAPGDSPGNDMSCIVTAPRRIRNFSALRRPVGVVIFSAELFKPSIYSARVFLKYGSEPRQTASFAQLKNSTSSLLNKKQSTIRSSRYVTIWKSLLH